MSNNSSSSPLMFDCTDSAESYTHGYAFNITKMALFFPLYTFILYLGVQKWKQKNSFTTASNSEIFTYHLAAFELLGVVASCLFSRILDTSGGLSLVVYFLLSMNWYGENYFHVLTCLEQYLAVVHPIVYRRLRNARGVKIRNISIGFVWLLSLTSSAIVISHYGSNFLVYFMLPFAVCFVVVSFCCLSVLCVLIRPGPGERNKVDQSKQKAFYTILVVLVVLWMWLGGVIVAYVFFTMLPVRSKLRCVFLIVSFWFNLPSGLVSPLLYLYRAGKLSFCCHKNG